MTAPQRPGSNLADLTLGSGPRASVADEVLGAPLAPPAAPIQPVALAPQQPAAQPVVVNGRAWLNVGGTFQSVPANQVDAALAQTPLARLATPEEVERRLLEKDQEGFVGGVKAAGQAGIEGLYTGISSPIRGLAALGYAVTGSNALADFVRETSAENIFPTISEVSAGALTYGSDADKKVSELGFSPEYRQRMAQYREVEQAEQEAINTREARRAEWPMLTTVAETTGLITGAAATALAGGAAIGGTSKAAQLAFGGSALRQGAVAGAEGLLQGATQPFTATYTPTQRDVLKAAAISGALSAGLGYGIPRVAQALPDNLAARAFGAPVQAMRDAKARFFGKSTQMSDEALDDMARQINPDAHPGAARDAVEAKEYVDNVYDSEVRQKVAAAAGKSQAEKQAIADEAVEEFKGKIADDLKKIGRIDETNWDKIPAKYRALLREDVIEGASRDWVRNHDTMLTSANKLERVLKDADQKTDLVAKRIAASNIDQEAAIGSSRQLVFDLKNSLDERITQALGDGAEPEAVAAFFGKHRQRIKDIRYSLDKADETMAKSASAADAFIAVDKVRRNVYKKLIKFQSSLIKGADEETADAAEILAEWAEDAYKNKLITHLADESVWGAQGANQARINWHWKDKLQVGDFAENSITTRTGRNYAESIKQSDPDKARSVLGALDESKASLRKDRLLDYYDAQEKMALAVKESYDLPADVAKAADEAIVAARRSKQILQTVERNGSTVMGSIIKALSEKASTAAAGTVGAVGGAVVGGGLGSMIGAMVLPAIQSSVLGVVRRLALRGATKGAAKEVAGAAGKKLGKEYVRGYAAQSFGLGQVVSHEVLEAMNDKPREERFKRYQKRQEVLANMSSNSELQMTSIQHALGGLGDRHPALGGTLGIEMINAIRQTSAMWPGSKSVSPIKSMAATTVTSQDIGKSEALWEAMTDPSSIFEDFENGTLDPDKVEHVKRLYPGMWQLYQAAVIDAVSRIPEDAPIQSSVLTQLDNLLGFNGALSPTVEKGFSDRITQATAKLAEEQPKPAARQLNLPTAKPTFTQRMMRS